MIKTGKATCRRSSGSSGARRILFLPFFVAITAFSFCPPTSALAGPPPPDVKYGIAAAAPPATSSDTPEVFIQDANRVTFKATNWGRTAAPDGLNYLGVASMYVGGLMVGAIVGGDGNPRVTNSAPVNFENSMYSELRPAQGPAGSIRVSYPGDPHGSRAGLGRDPDDDHDGRVNEDELNGLDDDGDGKIDEDFETIGEQMSVTTMRDDQVLVVGLSPLGIEVRQKIVQWSNTGLETFVGIEYRVRNAGSQPLDSVYVGYFADTDVGPEEHARYWTDDLGFAARIDTVVAGNEAGAPSSPLSIPVVYMKDAPDNGSTIAGGDAPEVIGLFVLDNPIDPAGVAAPAAVGITSATIFPASAEFGAPRADFEFYDLLSGTGKGPRQTIKPDDYKFYIGTGPFAHLDPGKAMTYVVGIVVGSDESDFRRRVVNALRAYNGRMVDGDLDPLTGNHGRETFVHWVGDYPLDPPDSRATIVEGSISAAPGGTLSAASGSAAIVGATGISPGGLESSGVTDRPRSSPAVRLEWDDVPETVDQAGGVSFEGYQIWRAEDWIRGSVPRRPSPDEWQLIATYRLHPGDSLGTTSPAYLDRVRTGPHSYAWTNYQVMTGRLYDYAVTTLGRTWKWLPAAERFEAHDVPGVPASAQTGPVVLPWPPGRTCSDIRVVPNPYHGSAAWDQPPGGCNPSGTLIAFTHLPTGWDHITIFSLTGDRVFTGGPSDSRVVGDCEAATGPEAGGTFFWDLRNERGDDVAPGVYMYAVEHAGTVCRGHFVILR